MHACRSTLEDPTIRPERVLVEEAAADQFTELCQTEMARLRQGVDPGDGEASIDVGAITWPAQVQRTQAQLADAVAKGARVLAGGHARPGPGRFFEPTLVAGVTPAMALAREETFGPVLAILRVPDAEAALAEANAIGLGLSGSVWSRDVDRARALARRLESGSVCLNDVLVNYFCVEAPLGGVKGSGLGVRHGPESLRQFCRLETIVEDHPVLGVLSGWISRQLEFPYQSRVLKALRWLMRRIY